MAHQESIEELLDMLRVQLGMSPKLKLPQGMRSIGQIANDLMVSTLLKKLWITLGCHHHDFVEFIEYNVKKSSMEGQRVLARGKFDSQEFEENLKNYLRRGRFWPNHSYNNPENNKNKADKPKIMFLSDWESSADAFGGNIDFWGYSACAGIYSKEHLGVLSVFHREKPDLVILEESDSRFDLRYAELFKYYRPGMPIIILGYHGKHDEASQEIPGVFYFNMEKQGRLDGLRGSIEFLLS